jgi:hypothetical protein
LNAQGLAQSIDDEQEHIDRALLVEPFRLAIPRQAFLVGSLKKKDLAIFRLPDLNVPTDLPGILGLAGKRAASRAKPRLYGRLWHDTSVVQHALPGQAPSALGKKSPRGKCCPRGMVGQT